MPVEEGLVWKEGSWGLAGGGHDIFIPPPSAPAAFLLLPRLPPIHLLAPFLATVPLLRHDKVMSVWSENLLITAIKDLCGSLGIWCFA